MLRTTTSFTTGTNNQHQDIMEGYQTLTKKQFIQQSLTPDQQCEYLKNDGMYDPTAKFPYAKVVDVMPLVAGLTNDVDDDLKYYNEAVENDCDYDIRVLLQKKAISDKFEREMEDCKGAYLELNGLFSGMNDDEMESLMKVLLGEEDMDDDVVEYEPS